MKSIDSIPLKTALCCFCLSLFTTSSAHIVIKGKIKSIHGRGVEYANVGIIERNTGTVSDTSGNFTIEIPDSFITDSLTFKHINYETKSESIKDLVQNKNNVIILKDKENILHDINILSQKIKRKWIGRGIKVPGYAEPNCYGEEFGMEIETTKYNALSKCRFEIYSCKFDSAVFRFNVYASEKKDPFYSKDIMIYHDKNKRTYEITVLLNLEESQKVFVSLEYVYSYGTGGLRIPIYSGKSMYRKTSLDKLTKIPLRMGFSIETISYDR